MCTTDLERSLVIWWPRSGKDKCREKFTHIDYYVCLCLVLSDNEELNPLTKFIINSGWLIKYKKLAFMTGKNIAKTWRGVYNDLNTRQYGTSVHTLFKL